MLRGNENLHDDVYGKTFELYSKSELEEFIHPFEVRLEKNRISAHEIFSGKRCLDAGCGGGRGTILMAKHGAQSIDAVDISYTNIETTLSNSKKFGFENLVKTTQSNLAKLPFPDEYFDFVWCNGVIMHTCDPDACLKEVTRVLKKGGQAWIYVYGADGIYWHCVDLYRKYLEDVPIEICIELLKNMNTKNTYISEYIDDWKTPYLRTYTHSDFENRLKALGFSEPSCLMYGMDYDTNNRISSFSEDHKYLGEGDLRYLLKKQKHLINDISPIPSDDWGSRSEFTYEAKEELENKIKQLNSVIPKDDHFRRIKYFAMVQRFLRDKIFNIKAPFDFNKFIFFIEQVIAQAEKENDK